MKQVKQDFLSKEEAEVLKDLDKLAQLRESEGYKDLLLPFLQAKVKNSWVDPRKVTDREQFFYEYATAWGWAQSAQELMDWIEERYKERNRLRDKADGKEIEKNFRIGT